MTEQLKGHGHVTPNADGFLARCGGPSICKVCKAELAALKAQQVSIPDERASFEKAVCRRYGYTGPSISSRWNGEGYSEPSLAMAWVLWRERAMLVAAPAADADDIVLNANAQEILSQCIGAHAYVLGVLANGRPDLAFIEAKKWVDAFKKAATQMEPGHD